MELNSEDLEARTPSFNNSKNVSVPGNYTRGATPPSEDATGAIRRHGISHGFKRLLRVV